MENQNKKCSQKKHSDINAVIYCVDCKRYLCNKCKNNHSELFEDHQFCNLDKNVNVLRQDAYEGETYATLTFSGAYELDPEKITSNISLDNVCDFKNRRRR